jgi:hypothetical protein
MFRRPKKPIRPRLVTTDDPGENDDDMDVAESSPTPTSSENNEYGPTKESNKLSAPAESTQPKSLLSFGGDDEDEEETFQVKKSSVSRRLMKQRDRVKKPKKPSSAPEPKNSTEENGQEENFLRILVGREAEAVDMESGSEDENDTKVNFRPRAVNVSEELRKTLDRDAIPDANLIHEVRKKRQMARDLGGYIPLDDGDRLVQI